MRERARAAPGAVDAASAGRGDLPGNGSRVLQILRDEVVACRACPRLVRHREKVARLKRRAFRDQEYWGRPVPGFGDPRARLLLIGLAPAAHGGNRTGRMFTGDRSGEFLYAALHRGGFASQPHSIHRDDGLTLRDCYIVAAVRCAPPGNRPSPAEIARCASFLGREWGLLSDVRVVICLGSLAFRSALDQVRRRGWSLPRPLPRFGHGVEVTVPARGAGPAGAGARSAAAARSASITLLGCYHPSQQNTFTGRLTAEMMDRVFERARRLLGAPSDPPPGAEPGRARGRDGRRVDGGGRGRGEREASGWRSA